MKSEIPTGYYSAKEIAYSLDIPVQRVYNIWAFCKFRRYKPGPLRSYKHTYYYPIDKIRRIDEMKKKGLTYSEIKKVLKG